MDCSGVRQRIHSDGYLWRSSSFSSCRRAGVYQGWSVTAAIWLVRRARADGSSRPAWMPFLVESIRAVASDSTASGMDPQRLTGSIQQVVQPSGVWAYSQMAMVSVALRNPASPPVNSRERQCSHGWFRSRW